MGQVGGTNSPSSRTRSTWPAGRGRRAAGATLLDLASGAGEPAVTAARVVGADGRVTATDVSAPMVTALADRAARLGLANLQARQADMEALPFADASFDAVTCRYGLMYARDAARAS